MQIRRQSEHLVGVSMELSLRTQVCHTTYIHLRIYIYTYIHYKYVTCTSIVIDLERGREVRVFGCYTCRKGCPSPHIYPMLNGMISYICENVITNIHADTRFVEINLQQILARILHLRIVAGF